MELHQHVDGSIPAEVTWELMRHYRLHPADSLPEMRRFLEIQEGEEGTLLAYLDKMHYPLWVTQFYENVSKVVEAICLAAAAAGVADPRAALRAAHPHLRRAHPAPVDPRGAVGDEPRAAEAPADEARASSSSRCASTGPHIAKILARQALAEAQHLHERTGVVGFDIAGPERGNPPRLFRSAYEMARLGPAGADRARRRGRARSDYVWQAVDELGVDRIGHGCAAAQDPELVRRLARDRIAVEVCLSSNYHTGAVKRGARHPLHAFLEAGVPVALCCDNSTVSRTDALRESLLAAAQVGVDAVERIHRAADAYTFIKPETALATRQDD